MQWLDSSRCFLTLQQLFLQNSLFSINTLSYLSFFTHNSFFFLFSTLLQLHTLILPFFLTISNSQNSSGEFKFGSRLRYSASSSNNKNSLLLILSNSLFLIPLFLGFGFFGLRIIFINFFIYYNEKYKKP